MKRVVMIAVIMAVITSLFAFSVYAAPTMGASYTTSISSDDNNITAYAYAVYEEGVYQTSSTGTNLSLPSFLISVRIVNNTDKWVVKDTDQFKLRLNGNSGVGYPFECIDVDSCQITEIETSTGKVDFTIKGDNSFILAPNETYVLSFRFINSAGFTTSPSLQFFNNQFVNTAYTVDDLVSLPADEIAYLASLDIDLDILLSYLDYEGTSFTPQTSTFSSSLVNITGNTSLTFRSRRDVFPCYYVTEDIELDAANDVIVQAGSLCYPVCISTYWRNAYTKYDYSSRYYISCSNMWPSNASVQFVSHDSNYSDYWYENGRNMTLFFRNGDSQHGYMTASHLGYSTTWFNVYVPAGITPDFGTYAFDPGTIERIDTDDNRAINVFDLLKNLYKSLVKSDSEDNTEEAAEMNDEIHEQEQTWYDNNSDALENVGLSNYRFSQSQSSGIYTAVTQFQAVWNALGNWTNIYIFILILSISTYIIRHEPTTRVKQYRSSVQAERAERISYYGRKNAESRASDSSGSTMKNAIRRRK